MPSSENVLGKKLSLHHIIRPATPAGPAPAPLLVLLHGVGSNERDLFSLTSQLDPRFLAISVRAPMTLGRDSYGWYQVQFTPTGPVIDLEQTEAARVELLRFLDELVEAYPVDRDRVYLMGFSQGCAMSLSAALTAPQKVAGVVGMSGRLLPGVPERMASEDALRGLPMLVVHGTEDTVLPIAFGREIRDALQKVPVDLTYQEYRMGHHVSPESLHTVKNWLQSRLDAPRHRNTLT